ncbi:MAG: restriction endonuclease [Opitutaceae bacterium]|nr:restriction endonuclease [Opitutaceae bacterium]
MNAIIILVLALGLMSHQARAQAAADIAAGTHISKVIKRYGWPNSKLSAGDKDIYIYDGFEVTFEADVVTSVTAVASRTKPVKPTPRSPGTQPPTQTRATPAPVLRSDPSATPARTESSRSPAPQNTQLGPPSPAATIRPTAPPPKPFAGWVQLLWFPVIAIAGVAVAKLAIASIKNGNQFTEQLLGGGIGPPPKHHTELTHDLLDQLEWRRFEDLVCLYYRALGQRAELTGIGADGGVDIKLYTANAILPTTYVQCKAWGSRDVDVKPIRELFGVMSADRVLEGLFITTGRYTASAMAFARGNGIQLISGADFIRMFSGLPIEQQIPILTEVTSGDFTTPSCPSCNIKLVLRSEGKFWGCRNYPRCKTRIYVRRVK